jgi:hypothetical protein
MKRTALSLGLGGLLVAMVGVEVGCSSSSSPANESPSDAEAADSAADDGGSSATDGGTGQDATVASGDAATGTDATVSNDAGAVMDATGADVEVATNDAGDAGVDAGWSPGSLPGLALWLDAHKGVGLSDAGVASDAGDAGEPLVWLDQSGHGNNATGVGSTAVHATALDGQPAVHFNGTTDYLLVPDSPTLQWGTGDFVLAIVVQHSTPADGGTTPYGTLYSKQVSDVSPYNGVGLFANTPSRSTALLAQLNALSTGEFTTGTSGYNDDVPFVVVMHRTIAEAADAGATASDAGDAGDAAVADAAAAPPVGTLTLLIDGVDAGSGTGTGFAGNVSATGYPLRIGGTPGTQDLAGDIAEVIGIQGSISDADLSSLQEYLQHRYGL